MEPCSPIRPRRGKHFYRNAGTVSSKLQRWQEVPEVFEDASESRGVAQGSEVPRTGKDQINLQEKDGNGRLCEFQHRVPERVDLIEEMLSDESGSPNQYSPPHINITHSKS